MFAHVQSAALRGIDAFPVAVEVDVSFGLPLFAMVGLPDASVRESRDRVRAAIRNSGFDFPDHRITVNLAPADVRKAGASFDLPIAIAILAATGVVPRHDGRSLAVVGELSLDGAVLATRGVLPVAIGLRRQGIDALLLPHGNAAEAAVVAGLTVLPVRTLADAVACLQQPPEAWPPPSVPRMPAATPADADIDLSDVRGQATARRALEVAAAGGHHLLFVGPPGAGKTMLARRMPGVLPPLSFDEALEVTAVHSVAGLLPPGTGLLGTRPFRAPHHSASEAALVGGGSAPRPGDVTLAHHGVQHYHDRVSGPLRDRLDLTVTLAPVPFDTLTASVSGESSAAVRARVEQARAKQLARAAPGIASLNNRLSLRALDGVVQLDRDGRARLAAAAGRLRLSGRAVHRVLRVARTVADLEGSTGVRDEHLLEALQFRDAAPTESR